MTFKKPLNALWLGLSILPVLLFFTIIFAGFGLALHLFALEDLLKNPIAIGLPLQGLGYIPTLAYLYFVGPRWTQTPWKDVGFRMPSQIDLLWGIGAGFGCLILVDPFATLLEHLGIHMEDATAYFPKHPTPFFIVELIIITAVLAPIIEEWGFRALLLNAFASWMNIWLAILLSAGCFALAHASIGNFLPLMLAGVILAWVFRKRQNIVVSMLAHGIFNGIGVMLVLLGAH